jgi:hypothetical protein
MPGLPAELQAQNGPTRSATKKRKSKRKKKSKSRR